MKTALPLAVAILVLGLAPLPIMAHCDTMDGPVVKDAASALDKGDVTPVLKWVTKESEPEIRTAFIKTLAVRSKGADVKELADRYFFETVVRVHRGGEGAPFTGLKPGGADPGPAVAAADKALESGSPDALVKLMTEKVAAEIRARFARAAKARTHASDGVEAGRQFVRAYVEFVHHAERLYGDATGQPRHDDVVEASASERATHARELGHADEQSSRRP